MRTTDTHTLPKWKRGDLSDHIGNDLYAETILERSGEVDQAIERIMVHPSSAYERAGYRLVEWSESRQKWEVVTVTDRLRDVRAKADRRLS